MARPRTGRRLSLLVAVALFWSLIAPVAVLGGVAAGPGDDARAAAAAPTIGALQGFEADRTSFRITVTENGSAEWRFRYEKALNDSEREDFEAFAEEFNDNETALYRNFRERARWLVDNGSEATGREMSAERFGRSAHVEGLDPQTQALGVVEMSFRWEGFAPVTADGVEVGDVFQGGLYIGPNQQVVLIAGQNLTFVSALPDDADRVTSADSLAESRSVTWTGEKAFRDRRPRVVLTTGESTTAEGPGDGSPGSTETSAGGNPGLLLPVGALLVVVLVGVGAAVAYRSGALPPSGDGGAVAGSAGDDAAGVDPSEAAVGVTEEELLSDEERVINLLEENGGRMKQVDIVEDTEWSKSKVSMLLSDMEDDERISKLRVGRENIVSLTGHEPDAAGSPFEED